MLESASMHVLEPWLQGTLSQRHGLFQSFQLAVVAVAVVAVAVVVAAGSSLLLLEQI